jgi:hypothetical protein
MAKNVTIDLDAFNKKMAASFPDHHEAAKSEGDHEELAAVGFAGIDTGAIGQTIGNVEKTFCGAWPKVKSFANFACKAMGWLPGQSGNVALVKSFIQAMDEDFVPAVCGK